MAEPVAAIAVAYTVLSLIAFGWSFGGPFDFDDVAAITKNQTIEPGRVMHAPFATPPLGTATSGRPVVNLTFALNGAINRALGIDPPTGLASPSAAVSFRATNLLLHVATALLLFVVVRDTLTFGRQRGDSREQNDSLSPHADKFAFVLAVLWMIHPLQTEAVNYISAENRDHRLSVLPDDAPRSDAPSTRGRGHAVGKQVEVAARYEGCPARSLASDGVGRSRHCRRADRIGKQGDHLHGADRGGTARSSVLRRSVGRRLSPRSRLWMYVALCAAASVCVIADLRGARAETVGSGDAMSVTDYLVSQGWAIPHYLRLMLVPVGLSYDYGRAPVVGWASWIGLAALVTLGATSVALWRSPKHHRLAFLGTTFFLLLAPSSSFIPIRTEIAAERRVYLALAIVLALVGTMALRLLRALRMRNHLSRPSPRTTLMAQAALGCAAIVLVAMSARRSAMYRSPLVLWMDAARRVPTNARAFDNAGASLLRADSTSFGQADALFLRALAIDSTYLDSWIRRAAIAMKQNRLRDAESMYLRALRISPNDSVATSRITKLYLAAGQPSLAIPYMKRLAAASADPDALTDLGNAYFLLGRLDSAAVVLERAVAANPRNAGALRWLGATLLEMGRTNESIPYLEHALDADTSSALTYALLASAYGKSGRRDDAKRAAWAAESHSGADPSIRVLTARGLLAAGDVEGAERLLAEAARLEPRDPEVWTRLGLIQARRGRRQEALMSVNRALSIVPNYPPAQQARAMLQTR